MVGTMEGVSYMESRLGSERESSGFTSMEKLLMTVVVLGEGLRPRGSHGGEGRRTSRMLAVNEKELGVMG